MHKSETGMHTSCVSVHVCMDVSDSSTGERFAMGHRKDFFPKYLKHRLHYQTIQNNWRSKQRTTRWQAQFIEVGVNWSPSMQGGFFFYQVAKFCLFYFFSMREGLYRGDVCKCSEHLFPWTLPCSTHGGVAPQWKVCVEQWSATFWKRRTACWLLIHNTHRTFIYTLLVIINGIRLCDNEGCGRLNIFRVDDSISYSFGSWNNPTTNSVCIQMFHQSYFLQLHCAKTQGLLNLWYCLMIKQSQKQQLSIMTWERVMDTPTLLKWRTADECWGRLVSFPPLRLLQMYLIQFVVWSVNSQKIRNKNNLHQCFSKVSTVP